MDPKAYPAAPQIVVQNPPVTVVHAQQEFSVCHVITSAISFCCPCWCFGLWALILSLMSYTDHKTGNLSGYRSKRSIALGLSIAAIVIGSIAYIAIGVVYGILISYAVGASQGYNWEEHNEWAQG